MVEHWRRIVTSNDETQCEEERFVRNITGFVMAFTDMREDVWRTLDGRCSMSVTTQTDS